MTLHGLRSKLACFLLVACAPLAFAGTNAWTLTGPEGGAVYALAIHPTTPAIVMMGTARGIYRSTDSALSWTLVPQSTLGGIADIAFDPSGPNRVMATDGTLYISEDSGQTFQLAQGPAAQNNVRRIAFASDGTVYAICYGGGLFKSAAPFSIWSPITTPWSANSNPDFISVDPANPQTVYVGIDESGVYRSDNGGNSWSAALTTGISNAATLDYWSLAVDPTNPARVLLGSSGGIYLSSNKGAAWTQADPSPTTWVGFNPGIQTQATAIRAGGLIMRSTDSGATWPTSVEDLQTNGTPQARYFPGSSNHLLMTTEHGVADSIKDGDDYDFRTTGQRSATAWKMAEADNGQIFVGMNAGFGSIFRRNLLGNYTPILSSQAGGMTGVRQISALAVAAGNYNQVFAVNSGYQMIRTFNGGGSWTAPHPAFLFASVPDYSVDVKIAPSNANIAYVGRQVTGVWKTTNGGATFAQLVSSPPFIGAIAVDPGNADIAYVSGGPADASGVYKTTDGGVTWQQKMAPGGSLIIQGFTIDPTNSSVVYALAAGGIRKSTDGGNSWSTMNFGGNIGSNVYAAALLIDPEIPTTMFMVGSFNVAGFLRSVDGGATWEPTPFDIPGPPTVLQNAVRATNGDVVAATTSAGMVEYTVAPDLAVSLSGLPDPLPSQSSVTARIKVTNLGPYASSASTINLAVPGFVTVTAPTGCSLSGTGLICNAGVLRVGESQVFSVPLSAGTGSTQGGLSVTVNGHEDDPVTANNNLTYDFEVRQIADVHVDMTAAAGTIERGKTTSVRINAGNSGPSPAGNTRLSVLIPGNLQVENFTASASGCTWNVVMIDCSFGTLASGASLHLDFDVRGVAPGVDALVADIHGGDVDPDPANSASREITVQPIGDVSISVAESDDPVTVGDTFSYTATLGGVSGDRANVQFGMDLGGSAGGAIQKITSPRAACTFVARAVNCSVPDFAAGDTTTVTMDVVSNVPGILLATATATYGGTETDTSNNTASIGTTLRLVGDVDVAIAESVDPATVAVPFNYTVTVHNSGPNAGAVNVTVPVSGANVTAATTSAGTCGLTTTAANCALGTLASGASATVNITVLPFAAGSVSATATATFAGVDLVTANNTASIGTTVRLVGDLDVAITDSADPATVDVPFVYTVSVHNAGPNAGAVNVKVPITGDFLLSKADMPGATCEWSSSAANCTLDSLASGASATLNVSVIPNTAGTVSATATATFAGVDPVTTNNSATADTTVRAVADVGVTIAESADPVTAGTAFSYLVTLTSTGPSKGVTHLVVPVTGSTPTEATPSPGGTCRIAPGTVLCDFPTLGADTATVIIVMDSAKAGTTTATATATFSGTDPVPTNNSATIDTQVQLVGDLGVELTDSADPVIVGGALSYLAAVRNQGPNAGPVHFDVSVTGGTVGSVTAGAGGTCTTALNLLRVDCEFASVNDGSSATATIAVNTTVAGAVSATAQATFTGGVDPALTNNHATAMTTVNAPPSSSSSSGGGGGGGGGGKGGGGRFDWLALGLLGVLVAASKARVSAAKQLPPAEQQSKTRSQRQAERAGLRHCDFARPDAACYRIDAETEAAHCVVGARKLAVAVMDVVLVGPAQRLQGGRDDVGRRGRVPVDAAETEPVVVV